MNLEDGSFSCETLMERVARQLARRLQFLVPVARLSRNVILETEAVRLCAIFSAHIIQAVLARRHCPGIYLRINDRSKGAF